MKEELAKDVKVTWAGFHSKLQASNSIKPPAVIGILPVFREKSSDPAMVKHVMHIVKENIQFLNPGQTPVLGGDQPLYALAKQMQWKFPEILGEDKYVLMLSGLHIDDKIQNMMGKFLRGSG